MGSSWSGPIVEEVNEGSTTTPAPQTQTTQQVVESRGFFATVASWFTQPAPDSSFYDLPDECVTVIIQNLSQFEWSSFALVCKRTNGVVQKLFLHEVWRWGYTGESITGAIQYRREFYQELASCDLCYNEASLDLAESKVERTTKVQIELNLVILSNLTQDTIINIFKSPFIFCLEKTKKIVKQAIQNIQQWDLSRIPHRQAIATVILNYGAINNDQEIVNLALTLGAALNELTSIDTTTNFSMNTFYMTDKIFWHIHNQIVASLYLTGNYKGYQTTSLHYLIHLNPTSKMVDFLLEIGADPTIADQVGDTPLHSAMRYGHYEISHLLLEHDAQVNAPNHKGQTPFHFACLHLQNKLTANKEITAADRQFIYQLRITHGADWDAADRWGKTPGDIIREVAAQSNGQFQLPDELQQQDRDE